MIRKTKLFFFVFLMIIALCGCSKEQKESDTTIEDTVAPVVTLNTKYVFSNEITRIDLTSIAKVYDTSSYTEKLCKFQKIDDAKPLDEQGIKEYTNQLAENKTDELLKREEATPVEDGIYSAVYLVEDTSGNKTAKELLIIYDTTAAQISGMDALVTEIEVDDINAEYTDDLLDKLTIADAFDGVITKDMLVRSVVLTNADEHIYSVKAEYTDRAGNKTDIAYDIALKEKKKEIPVIVEPIVEPEIETPVVEPEVEEPIVEPEIVPPVTEEDVEEDVGDTETEDSSEVQHIIPVPEEWNLIVVNEWNKIPENYVFDLVELEDGHKVDSRIQESLQQMFDAAAEEEIYMIVREAYRTSEEQQKILDEKIQEYIIVGYTQEEAEEKAKKWVAEPGTSEHELGLAVDINADLTKNTNDEVYKWLAKNAREYGFILRYPKSKEKITGVAYEAWHYRYVGVEVARMLSESGMCLEEYLLSR